MRGKEDSYISNLRMLKIIPRSGWISRGVALSDVESVAEHSYSTSALAMFLADKEVARGSRVSVERVLRLALLHDLAEALTFDISKSYLEYLGQRGKRIKREIEGAAWAHIIKGIGDASIRRVYSRLLAEFNAGVTLESQIVHAADKLDILLQIISYHHEGYPRAVLADLWTNTNRALAKSKLASVTELRRNATRLYEKSH
jgi:putative hydrolase of HD superfamily